MKKQFLLLVMMLLPLVASADAVEIDGIWYNLVSKIKTAEVAKKPSGSYSGAIVIPEKVTYDDVEYSVTGIGDNAFSHCSGLTSITIPNSVTSLGNYVLYDCKGLTSITIPNSVTTIGDHAFSSCILLTSVTIPNSVTSLGNYVFRDCKGLTSITIGNSVTSLGNYAFYECRGLTSITIGNSVTSIGELAFYQCSGLTSITIPNSVTSIGKYAFQKCSALTSITIPNSVTTIGDHAFQSCVGLTSITIPSSVTSIGNSVFYYCSGLTSITIPNSVTSIRNSAFRNCTGLTSVTIGNSVTSIGELAFYQCSGLTSITIGNSVKSIGQQAFSSCSGLTSITIGNSVKSIGSYAFAHCSELIDVICMAESVPNTNSEAFADSYIEYATLHVPETAIEAYKAAEPWKNFKSIVGLDGGDTPEPSICEKPTISYQNGKLTFSCETEGAVCHYSITDSDIQSGDGNEVQLTVTYNISVYASKAGYDNSDVATATLCWIDVEPETEGITNGMAEVPARAVMIQSNGGTLNIQGVEDGTQISVYSVNGSQVGTAVSSYGQASVNTSLQPGSIAIVKIGQKSMKVFLK